MWPTGGLSVKKHLLTGLLASFGISDLKLFLLLLFFVFVVQATGCSGAVVLRSKSTT